jgi:hypothetical protein
MILRVIITLREEQSMPRNEHDFLAKEQIERRAYELYLQSGCKNGKDVENWLTAEKELTKELAGDVLPAKRRSGPVERRKRSEAAAMATN